MTDPTTILQQADEQIAEAEATAAEVRELLKKLEKT